MPSWESFSFFSYGVSLVLSVSSTNLEMCFHAKFLRFLNNRLFGIFLLTHETRFLNLYNPLTGVTVGNIISSTEQSNDLTYHL